MRNLLRKMGFARADEMDMYIANLSMRNQLLLIYPFLLIWVPYDYITSRSLGPPFFLLILMGLVSNLSLLYYRRKLSGKNEE